MTRGDDAGGGVAPCLRENERVCELCWRWCLSGGVGVMSHIADFLHTDYDRYLPPAPVAGRTDLLQGVAAMQLPPAVSAVP